MFVCLFFHRQGHWQVFFEFELLALISVKVEGVKKRKERLQESEKCCFGFTWIIFYLLIGLIFVIISLGTAGSVYLNITNTQGFRVRLPVLKLEAWFPKGRKIAFFNTVFLS